MILKTMKVGELFYRMGMYYLLYILNKQKIVISATEMNNWKFICV